MIREKKCQVVPLSLPKKHLHCLFSCFIQAHFLNHYWCARLWAQVQVKTLGIGINILCKKILYNLFFSKFYHRFKELDSYLMVLNFETQVVLRKKSSKMWPRWCASHIKAQIACVVISITVLCHFLFQNSDCINHEMETFIWTKTNFDRCLEWNNWYLVERDREKKHLKEERRLAFSRIQSIRAGNYMYCVFMSSFNYTQKRKWRK